MPAVPADHEAATPPSSLVPGWRAPRAPRKPARSARKAPLTADTIIDAALAIIDAEGLDALSMRRVAQSLDTGAASLYAHVQNKEELIELVLDRVNGELRVPPPDPERWQEQTAESMRQVRDVYAAHRDLAKASFGKIPTMPNTLRSMEAMLAMLRAGGLPDLVIAWSADLIALYTTSAAYEQGLMQLQEELAPGSIHAYFDEIRDFFENLPPDEFPTAVSLFDVMTQGDGDERFMFGAEVILLGMQAYAERMRAREAGGKPEPFGRWHERRRERGRERGRGQGRRHRLRGRRGDR
ncbi:TetR/AcrR family transcriptional regulator [Yinghuangia seranimata]|uniref:TetR/AcrR family transcriptional regulator n=1 Tax=Yinghuangia seranimata TaxID=408067 RepID=UPI00248CCF67|nr:TetR/AcrR family transcriptional regulator [Yinghuangia seranimata]MDI2130231.1 TetR/AcrR family transcriptional regulator [Yinghuangia seranimata]